MFTMTEDFGLSDDPEKRDYPSVELPDPSKTPYSEWDANQRRKYIMSIYEEVYSPQEINKTDLADKFDVSRETIYRDIRILRAWYNKHLDKDFENIANRTIRWAVKKLRDQERPGKAVDVVTDWQDFLQEEGVKDKEPDPVNVTHDEDRSMDIDFNLITDSDEDGD